MNRAEHMMTTAAEEAMEVGHRITKAMRFGVHEVQPGQDLTNAERVLEEFYDLFAMLLLMSTEGVMPLDGMIPDASRLMRKREKFERFLAISAEQGTLTA